jgi:hypothetical protein
MRGFVKEKGNEMMGVYNLPVLTPALPQTDAARLLECQIENFMRGDERDWLSGYFVQSRSLSLCFNLMPWETV